MLTTRTRISRISTPRFARLLIPLAPSDLLFEENRRHLVALQTDPVPHVAFDNHRPAFDHTDRQVLRPSVFIDVENQCLARSRRLTTDRNPLGLTALLHCDVAEAAHDAIRWFHECDSFLCPSISHAARLSKSSTEPNLDDGTRRDSEALKRTA